MSHDAVLAAELHLLSKQRACLSIHHVLQVSIAVSIAEVELQGVLRHDTLEES